MNVVCGSQWAGQIIGAGGHFPYTYSGSSLPAGMTVNVHNGNLFWVAPCDVVGQTLSGNFSVTDTRGTRSPAIAASFFVQSSQTSGS
jgi:hypothetical protein